MSACCAPHSTHTPAPPRTRLPFTPPDRDPAAVARGMVPVQAGSFRMGGTDPEAVQADGEGPVRQVRLSAYLIDPCTVTNRQFAAFVRDTGYVTDAERYGWAFVFYAQVPLAARSAVRDGVVPGAPWWLGVDGATWRTPEGPDTSVAERPNHPVVQVSHHDASAYAAWAGKQLPTEAQWERAARGGLDQARYPWGDELAPRGQPRCNIWQGRFPHEYTGTDGQPGPCPVKKYRPNGLGLYQASGNVWEWCADVWSSSWHVPDEPHTRVDPRGPAGTADPAGTAGTEDADGAAGTGTCDAMVVRGGSYLCHDSYCTRYRVAARTANSPDSATSHTGFRCAAQPA